MKTFELSSLRKDNGMYIATLYNMELMYFKTVRFLWYSRREIISKLRHEYDCKVSNKFA